MNTTNILVVGIGGQGVMTATEILSEAALSLGLDVKKTEVAGMAQRGGVVTSHLRFGHRVLSPQIAPGTADILLAFEPAEALRWAHYLKPGGEVLSNVTRLIPPVVNIGLHDYPEDPISEIRLRNIPVHDFDAGEIAKSLGELRLVNTIMLGAIADRLPFSASVLRERVLDRFARKGPKVVEINAVAFDRGREAATALA